MLSLLRSKAAQISAPRLATLAASPARISAVLPGSAPAPGATDGLASFHRVEAVRGGLVSQMHTSAPAQSATLVMAGVGITVAALAARTVLKAVSSSSAGAAAPEGEKKEAPAADAASSGSASEASSSSNSSTSSSSSSSSGASAGAAGAAGAAPSGSGGFFGAQSMARRFYRGGFEDKMTRREAALILGVRESADPSRIRDRHRKLLLANHPDTGGSTFIAAKINEAKTILMKGGNSS